MKFAKPSVRADVVLSVELDETRGVLLIATSCKPDLNLGVRLGYPLTRDDARQLASALLRWAGAS